MTNGMTRAQSLRYACEFVAGRHSTDTMTDIELVRQWPPVERARRVCEPRKVRVPLYARADEPQEVIGTFSPRCGESSVDPDTEARRARRLAKFKHLLPRK